MLGCNQLTYTLLICSLLKNLFVCKINLSLKVPDNPSIGKAVSFVMVFVHRNSIAELFERLPSFDSKSFLLDL